MAARIAPSLLAADFSRLADEIARVEAGGADLLHLDIMDGHFVPNISFGLPVVEAVRRTTELPLDTHLMLSNPGAYLEAFRDAGANSLTVHVEVDDDIAALLAKIRALGLSCGLTANPATPINALFPYLDQLDLVLVMAVQPGFGGQSFQPQALEKVQALRAELDQRQLNIPIEIDGGVGPKNAAECRRAGVEILVAGTAVFAAADPAAAIRRLRA